MCKNVKEYRRDNQQWRIQRNWYSLTFISVRKTKTNKTKTHHNVRHIISNYFFGVYESKFIYRLTQHRMNKDYLISCNKMSYYFYIRMTTKSILLNDLPSLWLYAVIMAYYYKKKYDKTNRKILR